MPKRPCLVCGQLADGSWCQLHKPKRKSGAARRRMYGALSNRPWGALRAKALLRDGHRCVVCGERNGLEAHHVLPLADGGQDLLENLETRCADCHRAAHR